MQQRWRRNEQSAGGHIQRLVIVVVAIAIGAAAAKIGLVIGLMQCKTIKKQ